MHTLDGGESYGGKSQAEREEGSCGEVCNLKYSGRCLWESSVWAKIYMRWGGGV